MDFKKIDKASKLAEKIKAIDAEIIAIDKMALLLADKETESSFTMSVEDLTPKEGDSKVGFDEDGSLVVNPKRHSFFISSLMMDFDYINRTPTVVEKKEVTLPMKISVREALTILGFLLDGKRTQRDILLAKIEKIFK